MPAHGVPGAWPQDAQIKVRATNRRGAAVAVGDVVMFDLSGSDGDVNAYATDKADPFKNVILATTARIGQGGIFGVVSDLLDGAGANDTEVEVLVQGVGLIFTAAATSVGILQMPQNGSDQAVAATSGNVAIGMTLTSSASTATAGTVTALIDGMCIGGGPAGIN